VPHVRPAYCNGPPLGVSFAPLGRERQGRFAKQLTGSYLDSATFFRAMTEVIARERHTVQVGDLGMHDLMRSTSMPSNFSRAFRVFVCDRRAWALRRW
jgi:hypothetical protein